MSAVTQGLRFRYDHRWTPGRLSPYLDEDLRSGARRRLERHVAQCPECRGMLRSLERMLLRLGQVPSPTGAEAPGLAARVRARLDEVPAG